MTIHVRLQVAKQQMCITVYMCMKKPQKTFYVNFEFSGEGKEGQNNKVFGTLRNQNRLFL